MPGSTLIGKLLLVDITEFNSEAKMRLQMMLTARIVGAHDPETVDVSDATLSLELQDGARITFRVPSFEMLAKPTHEECALAESLGRPVPDLVARWRHFDEMPGFGETTVHAWG